MISLEAIEAYVSKRNAMLYVMYDSPASELVVAVSISTRSYHYFRGSADLLRYEYTFSQRNKKRRRLKSKHIQNLIDKLKQNEQKT